MKAAWYEKNGPARDVLTVGSISAPIVEAGEVLVRVHTSGVNPSDVKTRAGRPLIAARIVPHSDGAGIIEAVGHGVPANRIGERVWLWNGQWKRAFGTAAEFIAVPQEQAVPLPSNTTFVDAACLGIPALTALHALATDGSVLGRTVLIQGGAGAVGAYAIQMARLLGAATVIATVSSDAKATVAKELGADYCINYKTENIVERVKEITNAAGVDRIIEVDAAANVQYVSSILAKDGLYVVYGSGKPSIGFEFGPMITMGVGVRFFIVYALPSEARRNCIGALNGYLKASLLKHMVAKVLPLSEISAAHEAVESGSILGNVVLTLTE